MLLRHPLHDLCGPADDDGMGDFIQLQPQVVTVENQRAERRSIDGSVFIEDGFTKISDDFQIGFFARLDDLMGHFVGADDSRPQSGKEPAGSRLSACNSPGQTDSSHQGFQILSDPGDGTRLLMRLAHAGVGRRTRCYEAT